MYHIFHDIQVAGKGIFFEDIPKTDQDIYPISYGVGIEDDADQWIKQIEKIIKIDFDFLQKPNVKFVLFDLYEASKDVEKSAERFQKLLNKRIFVVSANRKLNNKQNIDFVFNDHWLKRVPRHPIIMPYKPKKLYINLTRVARTHRCILLDSLIDNNLFDIGYNTISDLNLQLSEYLKNNPQSKIDKKQFQTLDVKDLYAENPNYYVPIKACKKSFVYIATETLVDNTRMFFSEKVYKPIAIGMPFITLGNPGTLDVLKNLGYQTFSQWFNEDYDKDIDINDRIKIIIENLQIYANKSNKDLELLRKKMKSVCVHNQNNYKIQQNKISGIKKLWQQ